MRSDEEALFDSRQKTLKQRIAECAIGTIMVVGFVLVALAFGEAVGVLTGSATVCAWQWNRNRRHNRTLEEAPTVKIGTGAPGHVKIWGDAERADSRTLRDPLTHEPCLWFGIRTRQLVRVDKRTQWIEVKKASSWRPFVLRDHTGACRVIPEDAEVRMPPSETISESKKVRHELWRIREGDRICVVGRLRGPIDQLRTMEKPSGGAPFILSDLSPEQLTQTMSTWSFNLLVGFSIVVIVLGVMLWFGIRGDSL